MIHLGDITKMTPQNTPYVDCVTFGSPCQDLSIAGKREGLAGQRSGLFMDAVRVIKNMYMYSFGAYPKFAVWENVPGAFSSNKGEDFRAVLEELARIKEPEVSISRPESGKWAKAGFICGNGWSIAWRTLDAQFWGVPQRRKRIALVMDLRGQRAVEILFERTGVSGHLEPCIPPWKGIARNPAKCVTEHDAVVGEAFTNRGQYCGGVTETLRAESHGAKAQGIGWEEEKAPTCKTDGSLAVCYGICSDKSNSMLSDNPHSGIYEAESSRTLDLNGGNPSCNQGGIVVCQTIYDARGNGNGETCPTLTGDHQKRVTDYTAIVAELKGFSLSGFAQYKEQVGTLKSSGGDLGGGSKTLITEKIRNVLRWIIRRLTPMECERLQGFPDGWTDIGDWVDSKGRTHRAADTPRYKAIGNSIALPQWWWLTCKMAAYLPERATLGSLFDGIGGFPLVWETLHGKGTAIWASEIEEFPIAVTKYHFGED